MKSMKYVGKGRHAYRGQDSVTGELIFVYSGQTFYASDEYAKRLLNDFPKDFTGAAGKVPDNLIKKEMEITGKADDKALKNDEFAKQLQDKIEVLTGRLSKADNGNMDIKKDIELLKKQIVAKDTELKQQRNVILQKDEEFSAYKKEAEKKTEEKKLAGQVKVLKLKIKDLQGEIDELKVKVIEDK